MLCQLSYAGILHAESLQRNEKTIYMLHAYKANRRVATGSMHIRHADCSSLPVDLDDLSPLSWMRLLHSTPLPQGWLCLSIAVIPTDAPQVRSMDPTLPSAHPRAAAESQTHTIPSNIHTTHACSLISRYAKSRPEAAWWLLRLGLNQ